MDMSPSGFRRLDKRLSRHAASSEPGTYRLSCSPYARAAQTTLVGGAQSRSGGSIPALRSASIRGIRPWRYWKSDSRTMATVARRGAMRRVRDASPRPKSRSILKKRYRNQSVRSLNRKGSARPSEPYRRRDQVDRGIDQQGDENQKHVERVAGRHCSRAVCRHRARRLGIAREQWHTNPSNQG